MVKLSSLGGRNTPVTVLVLVIVIVAILFVATRLMSIKKRQESKQHSQTSTKQNQEQSQFPETEYDNIPMSNHPMAKPVQVVDSSFYADYFMPLP